jgi:hypothetical protein
VGTRAKRIAGIGCVLLYTAFIIGIYRQQPQTIAQVTGGVSDSVGAYRTDEVSFQQGLRFFRDDQFIEARAALKRADPAERDALTQFYVAYTFYRQGWGRLYHDNELYSQGLAALQKAEAAASGGQLTVDDPDLGLSSIDELRAELQRGLEMEASDLNPIKLLRKRQ